MDDQEKTQRLQRYYIYGLLPILCLWLLITIAANAMVGVFFLLGYMWSLMYYTPGFEEKASSKAYRFSFLGNFFKAQASLFSLMGDEPARWKISLGRLFLPLCFSGLMSVINPSWTPLWTILGWACFELLTFLDKKFSLNLF